MSEFLGDIAVVWTWQAFVSAGLFGLVFGFIGMKWIMRRSRWHPLTAPGVYALMAAVGAAAFLLGLTVSQVVVSLSDPDWVRIISRLGPNLTAAAGLGAGVWLALRGNNPTNGGSDG